MKMNTFIYFSFQLKKRRRRSFGDTQSFCTQDLNEESVVERVLLISFFSFFFYYFLCYFLLAFLVQVPVSFNFNSFFLLFKRKKRKTKITTLKLKKRSTKSFFLLFFFFFFCNFNLRERKKFKVLSNKRRTKIGD